MDAIRSVVPSIGRSAGHICRDAWRSLRSAPDATAFIVVVLTLGISAATVTFSVVDAVIFRSLPFDADHELVVVEFRDTQVLSVHQVAGSPYQFLAVRDRTNALASLAAVHSSSQTLEFDGSSEQIGSARVTASLFETLRTPALVGTTFTAAHEVEGNDRVAVIGYRLWQRRFGGDATIVGRSLQVPNARLVVIGVMPQGFVYPISVAGQPETEMWTPYVVSDEERLGNEQSRYLHLVGRLRSGESLVEAQSQVDGVTASLAESSVDRYRSARFKVVRLDQALAGAARGWMLLVLAAVGLVMLVACVNVANLLLTRATYRARELCIRMSLGATRWRLTASLLVESLMLSVGATGLAVLIAVWGVGLARASLPSGIARTEGIALDFRVLAAAIAASVLAGLVVGVVPAWQASRQDIASLLKQGGATGGVGRRMWRASFLVVEIAFVVVLLIGTALFISSFIRVTRADLGFVRSNLLAVSAASGLQGNLAEVVEQLQSIPGVTSVGAIAAGSPPLVAAGFGGGTSATVIQRADGPADTEPYLAEFRRVSSGYFATAGIPLVRGRVFNDGDSSRKDTVVIDAVAARHLFPDRDPIGAVLKTGPGMVTVIGVVGNVRLRGPEVKPDPQAYFPASTSVAGSGFVVRTSQPATTVVPRLQAALAQRRPAGSPPPEVRLVEEAFRNITAGRRFSAGLMSVFGALALLIGAAGIYGVMSSVVAQQTRELGVRVALGATARQILRGVLAQAGRYLLVGLVVGLMAGFWISRSLTSLLFEAGPTDIGVYVVVAGVLLVVGLAAALIPALRAVRVDPLVALRAE